ncbi:hypothetical protein Tco_0040737 [Tanacetum coccineum]
MEDGIFFNQSKYIKKMLKKFGLEDSKPTMTPMSTEIKLTKDDDADSVDSSKYRGTKMSSKYQQDYKKTRAYTVKIYNDPNMTEELRDIYRALETRYFHEGRTIDLSFYRDLNDDSMAKFANIGFDCLLSLDEEICPRTIHEKVDKEGKPIHKLPNQIETNELFDHLRPCGLVIRENVYSAIGNRDHTQAVIALILYCLENGQPFNLAYFIINRMYFFRYRRDKVLPYDMILTRLFKNLKANMANHQFDERYKLSPPSDNEGLPSTKLSPRSYSRALPDDPSMSKEQRETRGMFKNLGRALHNFARMLKKGCR